VSFLGKIFGRKAWKVYDPDLDELPDPGDWGLPQSPAFQDANQQAAVVSEVVLDRIAENDTSMPEELRGCSVVERRYANGQSQIVYRADDGFCAEEDKAEVLILAYQAEVNKNRLMPTVGFAAPSSSQAGSSRLDRGSLASAEGGMFHSSVPSASGSGRTASAPSRSGPPLITAASPLAVPPPIPVGPQSHGQSTTGWPAHPQVPSDRRFDPGRSLSPGGPASTVLSRDAVFGADSPRSAASAKVPKASGPKMEVLDQLPDDESVPKALRSALMVRRPDGIFYVTEEGRLVPKEEAEQWIDLWERAHMPVVESSGPLVQEMSPGRNMAESQPPAGENVRVESESYFPVRTVVDRVESASVASGGQGAQTADGASDALDTTPQTGTEIEAGALRMELTGRPVRSGWGFGDGQDEEDPWEAAIQAVSAPAGGSPAATQTVSTGDVPSSVGRTTSAGGEPPGATGVAAAAGVASELARRRGGTIPTSDHQAWEPEVTPTVSQQIPDTAVAEPIPSGGAAGSPTAISREVEADHGPAYRRVMKVAEAIRQDVIAGHWGLAEARDDEQDVVELCQDMIDQSWPDDRVERAIRQSAMVRDVLMEAAEQGAVRFDRSLRRELESGTRVMLLLNPARVDELDMALLSTLVRLRTVKAKRAVVLRELEHLFESVVVADLANYMMTRSFVEEFGWTLDADAHAVQGKVVRLSSLKRLLADLLSRRSAVAVNDIIGQVERRHGVTLHFLKPVLISALNPFFQQVVRRVVHGLKH